MLKQYLLGELSEDHLSEIEERILLDWAFSKQIMIETDELIDCYVHDLLSEREREKFESVFLPLPEQRQKIMVSLALRNYVKKEQSFKESKSSASRSNDNAYWANNRIFSLARFMRARVSALLA